MRQQTYTCVGAAAAMLASWSHVSVQTASSVGKQDVKAEGASSQAFALSLGAPMSMACAE